MTTFTDNNYFVLPTVYLENPNMYRVISFFEDVDDIETINNYLESDFDKNFKLHIKENGLKPGNDEINEIVDFAAEYPYCYFFINFEYLGFNFRDKNIFIIELINLLDISEESKLDVFEDSINNNCILIKLRRLLRNISEHPIPKISTLLKLSAKIDFNEMYNENLEY